MFSKVFSVDKKYVWPLSLLAIGAVVGAGVSVSIHFL